MSTVYSRSNTYKPPRIERRTPGHTHNIAVIGSRRFTDDMKVFRTLDAFTAHFHNFLVVSGGAPGPDTFAEHWAAKRNLTTVVHPIRPWRTWMTDAEWENRRFAPAANRRNKYICDDADIIVAFFADAEHTGGTAHSYRYAWEQDKPFFCFHQGSGWHRNAAAEALKDSWAVEGEE